MKRILSRSVLMAIACCSLACDKPEPKPPAVQINDTTWSVEVAQTRLARAKGLGGRRELAEGTGMMFLFRTERPRSFWMKDCLVPLDIAFLDATGKVVNLYTMPVESNPSNPTGRYDSNLPAAFVLEVPAGALARAGVRIGDQATLINLPPNTQAEPEEQP
jgi:uncharacterized membrane protein (UPF0127 family)